jgi:hypothetical protein
MSTKAELAATTEGKPGLCLLAGTLMLAVPATLALVAPPAATSSGSVALGLVVMIVLTVGAGSVVAATAQPERASVAGLAVLCAALALVLAPTEAWADGLSGTAALGFLMALRVHAAARRGPLDIQAWLVARRPMLVGAAVTTPAALAAALVPSAWSLPVAGLVGLVTAGICAALFAG